ncbi:MAG: transcription termination factor NusA [Patescibacteria group bacterium]
MASPIAQAMRQVCEEKGLSFESVLATVESALAAAYRKDFGEKNQNIKIEFDPESGGMRAFDIKTVVEDMEIEEGAMEEFIEPSKFARDHASAPDTPVAGTDGAPEEPKFNPKTMIMISPAKEAKSDAQIGEEIRFELEIPHAFGRMAAQTAKQVVIQKLREAERQGIYDEYKSQAGQVITGIVGRKEVRFILIDLGKVNAILPISEQVAQENYRPGTRLKVYVTAINVTPRGPEILVSRAHPDMLRQIFTLEIPEVQSGLVEVKGVAREAGSRSKVAVLSHAENVDPVGACIGQRGVRIQTIIGELGGEKIDVIKWEDDQMKFIASALSPAKVQEMRLDEATKTAYVKVIPDQLSLAIGRGGQNVRLASQLTGWRITIEGQEQEATKEEVAIPDTVAAEVKEGETAAKEDVQKAE